ncbi:sister chromatid cohesion protein DCC1 isoform X1 [Lycorma delicatula]|uniref:sister chromatid cohesion protein DCC1 isoform X1 n=1 Tax=Lycorma delicatula TaxID=130591 RepID=UPI003F512C43
MDGGKAVNPRNVRKLEEVKQFIEDAKLNDGELIPESQILYFADNFDDFRLLELNSSIEEAFKEGEKVVFRGENNKKAVLCTDSQTFEVLEAETSNASLLTPDLNYYVSSNESNNSSERYLKEVTIDGVFYSYYELRKIKPPFLYELEPLLNSCLFRGQEHEQSDIETLQKLYSTDDLLNICQASPAELEEGLRSIGACCIDGYWRLLDFDYHLRVFSQLLNLVDSNSWPLDGIPETETIEALVDIFPSVIVQHIFNQYATPTYERNDEGDALFSFIEDKVCRFLGEALLRDGAGAEYDFEEFMAAWQSSVPEGMHTNFNQLEGLAIAYKNNKKVQQIKLCLEQDLPRNVHERAEYLFSIKQNWTIQEITPFIKLLLPDKVTVRSVIMKYASESSVNGIKCYIRRS